MNFATYAGARIVSLSLVIPIYGLWSADVLIPPDGAVPDAGALVIGNASYQGTILRQAMYGGSRRLRIIGGSGGWRKPVQAQQYRLSSGVRASLLLGDAAKLVGERVSVPSDYVLGETYTRCSGPASLLLSDIAGASWYVDPSGTTQVAAWPTAPIRSAFTIIEQQGSDGTIKIATEDYAEWVPGKTFQSAFTIGAYTARGVSIIVKESGVARVEVLT